MEKSSQKRPLNVDELLESADEYARREPVKAVGSAFGMGLILHLLPLGAILSALAGVLFSLVRPALLVLGLLKAGEFLRSQIPTAPTLNE